MRALLLGLMLLAGAARAGVVAEMTAGTARLLLHDEAGPCVSGALLAEVIDGRERVQGCWALDGPEVVVVFMDASHARIPERAFRKPLQL